MARTKKCQGKESMERINYLFQIANQLMTDNSANIALSKGCTNLMIQVAKKSVQRIDVDMKRRICKTCKTFLVPGVSCKVRIKKEKIKWTCYTCSTAKLLPTKNFKHVWSEKNECIVELLNYGKD